MIETRGSEGPHFDAAEFDAFIEAHGTPALWRKARTCPCIDPLTGQATIGCPVCGDLGVNWDAGAPCKILAAGRERRDTYDVVGAWMQGMFQATFPSTITPGHLDMIEFTAAVMVVNNERLTRGAADKLGRSRERCRVRPVIEVEYAEAIVAGVLERYFPVLDFTIDQAAVITWGAGRGPSVETQYTLRYVARPNFVVWAPKSRDEGGTRQPYRALLQRLDFYDFNRAAGTPGVP